MLEQYDTAFTYVDSILDFHLQTLYNNRRIHHIPSPLVDMPILVLDMAMALAHGPVHTRIHLAYTCYQNLD